MQPIKNKQTKLTNKKPAQLKKKKSDMFLYLAQQILYQF